MDGQIGRPGFVDRIRGVPYFVSFLINHQSNPDPKLYHA